MKYWEEVKEKDRSMRALEIMKREEKRQPLHVWKKDRTIIKNRNIEQLKRMVEHCGYNFEEGYKGIC